MPSQTSQYNKPGKYRFSERNRRGERAVWIHFACIKAEIESIMEAVGTGLSKFKGKEVPVGKVLAMICKEWIVEQEKGECNERT